MFLLRTLTVKAGSPLAIIASARNTRHKVYPADVRYPAADDTTSEGDAGIPNDADTIQAAGTDIGSIRFSTQSAPFASQIRASSTKDSGGKGPVAICPYDMTLQ
ncbi:hypothetical protein RRG08_045070 [Elysia crispata]|uniref:Uncharacterized protein n=1 Tax=Elysia crispata TaxID=231223 RepID=A0AAE1CYM7_9GAST|nr:hypothetical protein RRG08_045070 [Elysia crispata]